MDLLQTINLSENDDNFNNNVVFLHAPLYNPSLFMRAHVINKIKMIAGNLWNIQDAMVYLFNQYLSKKETLCKWPISLDCRLTNVSGNLFSHCQRLITYATNDYLSLLQLILFIHKHLSDHFNNDKFIIHMGEYFVYLHKKY
ncbi:unnamed protein product [Adineta steineri]|uniref:Uncharacterized protein n=1 Tax=Adineta steineri TaxID=433720 RepID=A0A816CM20_9BILA|nr:unnamed protein product [Adineta steineri]CAF1622986.1 unnamed protein product [Adineta steineri]